MEPQKVFVGMHVKIHQITLDISTGKQCVATTTRQCRKLALAMERSKELDQTLTFDVSIEGQRDLWVFVWQPNETTVWYRQSMIYGFKDINDRVLITLPSVHKGGNRPYREARDKGLCFSGMASLLLWLRQGVARLSLEFSPPQFFGQCKHGYLMIEFRSGSKAVAHGVVRGTYVDYSLNDLISEARRRRNQRRDEEEDRLAGAFGL